MAILVMVKCSNPRTGNVASKSVQTDRLLEIIRVASHSMARGDIGSCVGFSVIDCLT